MCRNSICQRVCSQAWVRPRQTDGVQKKSMLIKLPKKDSGTTHAKGSKAMCHNTPPQSLLPLLPVVRFIRGAMHSLCVLVYCLFLSVLDAESTVIDLLSVSLSTTCYPCCFRAAINWDSVHIPLPPSLCSSQQMGLCTHPTPTHTSQQPANGTLYPSHSHPQFASASKWD